MSGSGEGPGRATGRGYSTTAVFGDGNGGLSAGSAGWEGVGDGGWVREVCAREIV